MSYKQKIVTENGGYRGFLTLNGEVVHATEICSTFAEAVEKTRQLQSTGSSGSPQPAPIRLSNNIPSYPHKAPSARCGGCGQRSYNL